MTIRLLPPRAVVGALALILVVAASLPHVLRAQADEPEAAVVRTLVLGIQDREDKLNRLACQGTCSEQRNANLERRWVEKGTKPIAFGDTTSRFSSARDGEHRSIEDPEGALSPRDP